MLAFTNKRIINFDGKSVKRMIDLEKIRGFTINDHPTCFEFVFHVKGESDYRYRCSMKTERDEILELIKRDYKESTKKSLPVYQVPAEHLRDFHTVKGDLKKNISRVPPQTNLLSEKSVVEETKAEIPQFGPQGGSGGLPEKG